MPLVLPAVSKRTPAAATLRSSKRHPVQCVLIPARVAWNCAACAAHWKPRPAAERSVPKVIRQADGLCVRVREAFNFGFPPTQPLIWMRIPVQDLFLWIVRSPCRARWDESKLEAKFAAAECLWK